jgi:isopenicillin N synthase-like dioxygenase
VPSIRAADLDELPQARAHSAHLVKETAMLLQVPVIDVAPFQAGDAATKREIARQVGQAVNDIGFLVITGHGVAPDLIDRVQRASNAFFDLPLAEKQRVLRPAPDVTRGYIPLEAESVGRSQGLDVPGDLNESLMIGPVDATADGYFTGPQAGKHFHPNLWPDRPAGLRDAYEEYFRTMGSLAERLMAMFALALDLPETFFADKIDRHISRLRVRNYPAPLVPPLAGQLRAGAHADYGSLTILRTEDKPGGLQVLNRAGDWVDVPIVPDCLIVNIGELMARWTNDRWKATLHRVVNPPSDQAAASRRLSLVFFHNPNYDAPVAALPGTVAAGNSAKYPPTTSGDHLRAQFIRTQVKAA